MDLTLCHEVTRHAYRHPMMFYPREDEMKKGEKKKEIGRRRR
jgi:hypothetical protein